MKLWCRNEGKDGAALYIPRRLIVISEIDRRKALRFLPYNLEAIVHSFENKYGRIAEGNHG